MQRPQDEIFEIYLLNGLQNFLKQFNTAYFFLKNEDKRNWK